VRNGGEQTFYRFVPECIFVVVWLAEATNLACCRFSPMSSLDVEHFTLTIVYMFVRML
jgi:hypothetical protein